MSNPYTGWTYFILFLMSTPVTVALTRYYDLFPIVTFDALLITGIITHFAFVLPPFLYSSFIFANAKDFGAGSFGAIVGIGIVTCFAAAALQAVFIEKFFTKKLTQ
ncbi:hypothetical protein [Rufibacter roseus]|uniref:Uncharacterized protein n=1 Tax=Rufibacter roseus TaxID=1567108 RepID=A0ABW2DPN1_9BACT|nr:hypothetical protein [Rufibacter roseus]